MQRRKWLADLLTRAYARLLDSEGVIDVSEYRAGGEAHRVFWVAARRWPAAGQYTPLGTVILNEERLAPLSERAVTYIFLHEVGHGRLPGVVTLVFYLIRVLLIMGVALGLSLLILGATLVESPGAVRGGVFGVSVRPGLLAALSIVGLVAVSWLHEGHADLFVVSRIGVESYREWHDEFVDSRSAGGLYRVLRRFVYPSPDLVLWVAARLGLHPKR